MDINSREIALKVLQNINQKDGYSNISIKNHINDNVSLKDEGFIRELVYGVVENKMYLDYIISKASKIKQKKIHPTINEILRLGIYQIVFMDKIPISAAVNESVKLAKKYGHKGTIGFVNGILRAISRDVDYFKKIEEKNEQKALSIKYSHPEYLVSRFIKEFGYDFTVDILKANNSKPLLNIRVNTIKTNKKELMNLLNKRGFEISEGEYAKDAIIVYNPQRITSLQEFKDGYFTIQDESSMLVGQILAPKEGSLVLDVCSAPGGKSTHIAAIMNNRGRVIARDLHEHKIRLIEENKKRLEINIIDSEVYDALKLDKSLIEKADYCLVDAPCSGFGLIRRKPEIKWNRKENDIKELSTLQYEILNVSKEYVKKGGILMYSTCTILDEENICIINKFLEENKNFKLTSIENEVVNIDKINSLKDGYIQLYPNIHNTDGFFIAKMVKEG
jgi:16S rRNA (cytosine967-C5)-methyltransferase